MEFYKQSNAVVLKPGGNCGKQSGAGRTWGFLPSRYHSTVAPSHIPSATADISQQLRASFTL